MKGLVDAQRTVPVLPASGRKFLRALPMTLGLIVMAAFGLLLYLGLQTGLPLLALALASLLIMAAVAGLSWHFGVLLTRRQLGGLLREAREQLKVQAQLQTCWQWATDAEHHLVRWQAPQGAPASAWVGSGPGSAHTQITQTLGERFRAEGDLDALLAGEENFEGLHVAAADGLNYRLRGVACRDVDGRFSGYQGLADLVPPAPEEGKAEQEAFAMLVSHDLRAPLRVAEGFTRILREDYGDRGLPLDKLGRDHLERVAAAQARMQHMIEALLGLTRLSVLPLSLQSVDLSLLAGEVADDLRRGAPERKADIRIEAGLLARGDPALLRMLLENLLGNAWKYSGACAHAQICFETEARDGRRHFVVGDNGAGFDMKHATRLFEAFQRLHSASEFAGNGLGLASVKRIVKRHGGEVWAEAETGRGARFYFTLAD